MVSQVHERGQLALEAKRTQYKRDMEDIVRMQKEMEEEEAAKLALNAQQKLVRWMHIESAWIGVLCMYVDVGMYA